MALKRINTDYQSFEFVTNSKRRLALYGGLISWQDEINPGVVEHQILKRAGALHQVFGSKPRAYTFRCTLIGTDGGSVGDRWRALADSIDEDPTGRLIHPRFSSLSAVCTGLSGQEDPGESVDEVNYTIKFTESGLRTAPRESAGSVAAGAFAASTTFQSAVPVSFAALAGALTIAVSGVANSIAALASLPGAIELNRQLRAVADRTAAVQGEATRRGRYDLYASASLIYARTIDAVNAAAANRPPVIEHVTTGDADLAAILAALYGGRWASAQMGDVMSLNSIPNPARILTGTRLLLADPAWVTGRSARG